MPSHARVLGRFVLLLVSLLCVPLHAAAQDFLVTSTADSGPGSLRQALADASDGDVIVLGPELSNRTITLQSTLVVDKSVEIDGMGAIDVQISGNDAVRIFDIGDNGTSCLISVYIHGMRLVHGATLDVGEYGGGIRTCSDDLQLEKISFEDSTAPSGGGALYQTEGTTAIVDSHFVRNHGVGGVAIEVEAGTLTMERVTFSDNHGASVLQLLAGTTTALSAVTMTGNETVYGGTLNVWSGADVVLMNTTIAGNVSTNPGGPAPGVITSLGNVSLVNSIVSNPGSPNCDGPIPVVDGGNNLQFGDTTCGLSTTADPELGPLGLYASSIVPTLPIASTSPAHDTGDNGYCSQYDGRGLARAAGGGGDDCDIGAFEYDGPLAITVTTLDDSGAGSLREALTNAGTGATVDFQAGLTGTLLIDSTLSIPRALTIQGPGSSTLTVARNTAAGLFTVMRVDTVCEGVTIVRGLTVKDGDADFDRTGGLDTCGPIEVEDVRFTNNRGAQASALITCCNYERAILRRVRFDGNSGPVAFGGDVVYATAIYDSSFTGAGDTFGIDSGATALLRNVTFSGTGGARVIAGALFTAFEHVTISTGDIAVNSPFNDYVSVANSILSGTNDACSGLFYVSRGHNVIQGPCGTLAADPTSIVADPKLAGPAVNLPGTVVTRGLMLDSPAIDRGDASICAAADARGVTRTPATCDAGAFEAHPITLSAPPLPMGRLGTAFNTTITATGAYGATTFALETGALPPGMAIAANGAISGTPTASGSFGFTITTTDATGVGVRQPLTLVIDGLPTLSTFDNASITRNGALGPVDFTIGDDLTPAGSLVLGASSSNQALVPDANITFDGTGTARTLRVTPLPHAFGTTTITVSLFDGVLTSTQTFTLTVMPVYVLAEGATGGFFDLDVLLANPNTTAAPITIRYLKDDGTTLDQTMTLEPTSRKTIRVDSVAGLEATAVSTIVTSTTALPIVVERTMTWDASGYGAHTEKATEGTASTWYFAEGSQGFFKTFLLLANQDASPNVAHVTWFREGAAPLVRDYPLPATSRTTIDAGADPELVNLSFGATVNFERPGVAERAMYFGDDPIFTGGTASAGVTAPSTHWFLAEGATGSYFNTFLLLANPSASDAAVTVTYLPATGSPVTKTYPVAAGQRATLNVALEDPSLASAAVAARVESTQPIVVERSQYWPVPQWIEAHNSFGVTEAGTRWGLAEGRVGGDAGYQTYVLLANPGSQSADVTVTFLRENGTTIVKTFTVAAETRVNVAAIGPGSDVPELADESFGVLIESTQPIVVERSVYGNANGVVWASGTNATATRLP